MLTAKLLSSIFLLQVKRIINLVHAERSSKNFTLSLKNVALKNCVINNCVIQNIGSTEKNISWSYVGLQIYYF